MQGNPEDKWLLNTGKIKLLLTVQGNTEDKWSLNTGKIKLVLTIKGNTEYMWSLNTGKIKLGMAMQGNFEDFEVTLYRLIYYETFYKKELNEGQIMQDIV